MKNEPKPFVLIVLLFSIGIIIQRYGNFPLWALAGCFLLGLIFLVLPRWLSSVGICLLLIASGAIKTYDHHQLPADDLVHIAKYYRQKPIHLRGWIESDVEYRQFNRTTKTVFTLRVLEYEAPWGWKQQNGKLLVQYFGEAKLHYGDYLDLEGKLHQPFDFDADSAFSYQEYLEERGIYRLLSVKKSSIVTILDGNYGNRFLKSIYQLRERMRNVLRTHLSFNEYGLMQAILLGDRSYIPKNVMTLFTHTGTVHIIAISGMNMTVIAGIFFIMVRLLPIGRRMHYLSTILLLLGYMVLVDGRPSVIRATLMAVVFLISFLIEKEGSPINTLAVAAFALLLINPFYLFDIGFQLSFVCVLSIFLLWPLIDHHLKRFSFFETKIGKAISFSLAVWIGSGMLIAYYFQLFVPINILANLWVVPIFTIIMILGLGLLFCGLAIPVLAGPFALCLKIVLNLMVAGVFLIEKIPGAYFSVKGMTGWHLLLYYGLISVFIIYSRHRTRSKDIRLIEEKIW